MSKNYPYTDEDKKMYGMRYNKNVGYYLLRKRIQLGISLRTVSTNTGISRSTISRIENSECKPSFEDVMKLLDFYHDVQFDLLML